MTGFIRIQKVNQLAPLGVQFFELLFDRQDRQFLLAQSEPRPLQFLLGFHSCIIPISIATTAQAAASGIIQSRMTALLLLLPQQLELVERCEY